MPAVHPWVSFVVHVISVPHVCFQFFYIYKFFSPSSVVDVELISFGGDWRHFFVLCLLRKNILKPYFVWTFTLRSVSEIRVGFGG